MNKLYAVALILGMATPLMAQADKASENRSRYVSLASVAVAKRLCAAHPDAQVWLYLKGVWFQRGCDQLAASGIFAPNLGDFIDHYSDLQKSVDALSEIDESLKGAAK